MDGPSINDFVFALIAFQLYLLIDRISFLDHSRTTKLLEGLAFEYSSPLRDHFNPVIDRILEVGVMEHLFDLYMPYRNWKEDFDALAKAEVLLQCFRANQMQFQRYPCRKP